MWEKVTHEGFHSWNFTVYKQYLTYESSAIASNLEVELKIKLSTAFAFCRKKSFVSDSRVFSARETNLEV